MKWRVRDPETLLSGEKGMTWKKGITGEQRLQIEASEVNNIQLLLCIQTHALDPFHEQVVCAKDTDYYPSLRGAHALDSGARMPPVFPCPETILDIPMSVASMMIAH